MRENDWTKVLGWPGYRVYRHEINEEGKTLKLWVRRKRGNRKLVCSGCGRKFADAYDSYEREVRDLPCFEYRTTVVVELYRVRCPDCGLKAEKVPQLPSKAPFSKRFEEAVGLACESAAVRRVARQFGLAASTVRAIDLRYLKRWAAGRRKPALRQMGVDEIYLGKKQKFLTVVSNLESGEPLWFGQERKKETLDKFFEKQLSASAARSGPPVWTCGSHSGKASNSGPGTAASFTTSFTSCSMPPRRWMKCDARNSSAREVQHGKSSRGNVGCCCRVGYT